MCLGLKLSKLTYYSFPCCLQNSTYPDFPNPCPVSMSKTPYLRPLYLPFPLLPYVSVFPSFLSFMWLLKWLILTDSLLSTKYDMVTRLLFIASPVLSSILSSFFPPFLSFSFLPFFFFYFGNT